MLYAIMLYCSHVILQILNKMAQPETLGITVQKQLSNKDIKILPIKSHPQQLIGHIEKVWVSFLITFIFVTIA